MKKVQLTMVYHTLDAQGSHDMKESFGITAYLEAYDSSQNFLVGTL